MRKFAVMLLAELCSAAVFSEITFDAGADLRVRQEFYDNAPLLPGDGSRSLFSDMIRFTLNFEADSNLDVFGLYDQDQNHGLPRRRENT